MSKEITGKELDDLRKQSSDTIMADPGELLYLLQGNRKRDISQIVKIDDQGNQEIILKYDSVVEGQAVMSAYAESIHYRKH